MAAREKGRHVKVVIVSTVVPFRNGGGRSIVDGLEAALEGAGHQVETYRIPFSGDWHDFPERTAALRLIGVPAGDRTIAIRAPSYAIEHPAKTVWFIRHFRPAYDLWGTPYGLPDTARGHAVRRAIHHADNAALAGAYVVYAGSKLAAQRLRTYNDVEAAPLHPPLLAPEKFRCEEAAGYLLYVAAFAPAKRQALALEAMCHVETGVRLVLAGPVAPEAEVYLEALRTTIAERGLGESVTLIDRWISQEEKIALTARASAVVSIPFDEASYGFTALEAAAARKPVITTTDSGDMRDWVGDDGVGWIVEPAPQALARAFDETFAGAAGARTKGEAFAERIHHLNLTWPATIERLLA
jgi:glycosyltransferase involved in cell wall biosynthesis